MILDNTSKTIQVVLGEAKTTTNPEYTAAYEDINVAGGTFVPGASDGSLNGVTLVTVVAAPASSTQRRVKELSVYNADTVNHTVTVQYYDGTNTELLVYTTIAPGQTLWYGGGSWQVLFGSTGNAVIITGGTIDGTTIGATTPEPGTFTKITFNPTTGGIVGTTTNDNASAGNVGEYVSSQILQANAIGISTNNATTVTSINLTAGDWDIWGIAGFVPGSGTSRTFIIGSISPTNNGLAGPDGVETRFTYTTASANVDLLHVPVGRFSLAGSTTYYLIVYATFSVSTLAAFGTIAARRVR